jgi:hypothetical protein
LWEASVGQVRVDLVVIYVYTHNSLL